MPGTLNVDFLRSGFEFKKEATLPKSPEPAKKRASPESPRSRNRRLDEFYNKTLQSFKTSDLDAWDGLPCSPKKAKSSKTETTAPAGPAVLNVDFLRSGAEFKPSPSLTRKGDTAVPSPRTTRNNRLEAFYKQSLEAANVSPRKAEKSPAVLNVDFLRSGAEFKPSPIQDRKNYTAVPSPNTTRNNRLEAFYKQSLEAANASSRKTEKSPAVLNVDFLRSGAEFKPSPTLNRKGDTAVPSPRTTRNNRLEAFYKQSLEAATSPRSSRKDTPSVVNVDFLRSGAEFKPSPTLERKGSVVPSPNTSRNKRLEEFYNRTLEAASNSPAPKEDVPVLNLDFLRSGAEFKPSPTTTRKGETAVPSPKTSRNARLEAFHKASLSAASEPVAVADLDAWDGMPISTVPTVVNLDYLRTFAYKETHARDADQTTPTKIPDGPTKSKNKRLAEFYATSMKVHDMH